MPTEELYGSYHFLLEVSGISPGTFRSVKVLSLDAATASGAQPTFQRVPRPSSVRGLRSPRAGRTGRSGHHNVTLKRGMPGPAGAGAQRSGSLKWQDISLKRPMSSASPPMPGRTKFESITLKRGPTSSSAPSPQQIRSRTKLDGVAQKGEPSVLAFGGFVGSGRPMPDHPSSQAGRIVLVGPNGQPVAQWHFTNAWPCKYTGPSVKSDSGDTVYIAFEGLRRT